MSLRPWVVASLAAVLLFAGCVDDSASIKKQNDAKRAGAKGQPPLPGLPNYTAVRLDGTLVDVSELTGLPTPVGLQLNIPGRSYEPTLGITKKGTIIMSGLAFDGPQGNPASRVWASGDKGATWKEVTPKLPTGHQNPPISFDPFIHVDPITDRIFTNDLEALVCSWMSWSDDEAKSWLTNPMDCGLPPGVHDHQSITTGKPRITPVVGYGASMMYYCVNRIGDSSCSASNNGGVTFGPLIPVMLGVDVERGGFCGGLHGHVKTDREGRVFLPKSQCGLPHVGVSEDDGKTWTVHKISSVGSRGGDHEVSIASDDANNLYALWIGDTGLPYMSMSKDHGKTWSPAKVVSPPGVTATDKPTIAAAGPGKVAFAYIGTTIENGYKNRRSADDWAGAAWNGYIGVITNALDVNPIVLTTTANPIGEPIAVNQCGGTRCGGLYDFIDIDIDTEGRPWAALVDVCREDCTKAHKADPKTARHDGNNGFVGTLDVGPSLLKDGGILKSIRVPVVPAGNAPKA